MPLPTYIDLSHSRLREYQDNKDLFKGKAWDVFGLKQFEYYKKINPENPRLSYVNYNWFGIISKTLADLICRGGIIITLDNNQEWFDKWRKESKFDIKVYEAVLSNSYLGDAVFKLCVDKVNPSSKDYDVQLYQVNPGVWFPEFDHDNPSKAVNTHTIVCTKKVLDSTGQVEGYAMLLEMYGWGKINYQAYFSKDKAKWEIEDIKKHFNDETTNVRMDRAKLENNIYEYTTNTDKPLIVHIPNFSLPDEFFGLPDYTDDIKSVVYSINDGYTSIESVRKKHIDPMLVVPESVIKQAKAEILAAANNEKASEYGFNSFEDFTKSNKRGPDMVKARLAAKILEKTKLMGMPSDGSQVVPQYITWDAKLEASFAQIKELKQNLLHQSEIASVLVSPDASTGQLTGVALKRLASPTLNKAERKIMYLQSGLAELIFTAQQLAIKTDGVKNKPKAEAEMPSIEFKPGLVEDLMEIINQNTVLLENHLISEVDAMIAIFDYTKKQAEKKQAEIQGVLEARNPFNMAAQTQGTLDGETPPPAETNLNK